MAFGTKNSLAGYQDYLDKLTFRMAPHETKVVDLLSPAGQTKEFKVQDEAGSRQIIPGIIAVVPIGKNGNRLFLLQGAQTTALISYLTSEDGMREMMEQTRRLKSRIDTPDKHWKLSEADFHEREFWTGYEEAYNDILSSTSRKHAPWFVIPSNHKWYRNVAISQILVDVMERLKLKYPPPTFDPSHIKL